MTKGYILPAVIDTDETVCLTITIPRKDEYILAMLGQIDELGYWYAWERDDAKRGKLAADLWKTARETVCMTDQCGNQVVTPVLKNEKDAAPIIRDIITTMIDAGVTGIDNGDDDITIIRSIKGTITEFVPDRDMGDAIGEMVTRMRKEDILTLKAWKSSGWLEDFYGKVFCNSSPDGSFLDEAAQAISDWLNSSSDWISEALNAAAAMLEGDDYTRMTNGGGDAVGVAEGPVETCDWATVASFDVPANQPAYTMSGHITSSSYSYAMKISGVVQYGTSLWAKQDAYWLWPVPPSMEYSGPLWRLGQIGLTVVTTAPQLSDDYWVHQGAGSGDEFGIKFNDTAYGDNSGEFAVVLYRRPI